MHTLYVAHSMFHYSYGYVRFLLSILVGPAEACLEGGDDYFLDCIHDDAHRKGVQQQQQQKL